MQSSTSPALPDSDIPSTTLYSTTSGASIEEVEEKKHVINTDHDETEEMWIPYGDEPLSQLTHKNDHQLRINKQLYEAFGIVAFVTSYNESTKAVAEQFVSKKSFMMGKISHLYGNRKKIEQEMGWDAEWFATSDRLFSQLQMLANESGPKTNTLSKTLLQNDNVIFALSNPYPTPYLPLILKKGIFLPDNYSLRIHASASDKSQPPSVRFKKFIFSFFLSGSDMSGKVINDAIELEEKSILTEAMNLPLNKKLLDVTCSEENFFEEAQIQSLNILALMMTQLGEKCFQVVCNLHYIDYLLYVFLLYFDEKISKHALKDFVSKTLFRKEMIEKRLTDFFRSFNIDLSFISSLENLLDINATPKGTNFLSLLLSQLGLKDTDPDSEEDNNLQLISACIEKLSLPGIKLMSISHEFKIYSIDTNDLQTSITQKTPILVKREKKRCSASTASLTTATEEEFYLFGDATGHELWGFTKITAKDIHCLNALPFNKKGIASDDPEFNQDLLDILKEGHAKFNIPHHNHLRVWNDFSAVAQKKKIEMDTLSHFLKLADAATIAIATQDMKSNEVCSIESSSRKYVQDTESLFTRVSDRIKAQSKYVPYATLPPNAKYPQRSAVNYSKRVQQPFTQFSTEDSYPVVFFISFIDPCIGKNLSDPSSEQNTAFYFKDTINKHALSLAKQSTFFGNASRNGALQKDDPKHTPLRKMVSLGSGGSG